MSRKINVRSPFYLFIDDSGLNTTTTTTTTTASTTTSTTTQGSTTSTTTVAGQTTQTTTLSSFGCPTLTGGSISQSGVITDPTISLGTIVGKSESYQGALVTSVAANNGVNNYNKTLYFKIQVPAGYTNTGGFIWCSKQFSQTTTTASTTASPNQAPTWVCSTGQLTGGSISGSGSVYYPSVTGGSITGFSLTNNGSLITSVSANGSSTANTITIWFKVLVGSSYYNAGSSVWCSKVLTQATTTTGTTTQATTTADPYNYYFVRGCSGTNYASNDMVVRTTTAQAFNGGETTGAAVFTIFGSCFYIYDDATAAEHASNAGDLNSQTVYNASNTSCSSCTGGGTTTASTTTTTTTTSATAGTNGYYLSVGKSSLSAFCGSTSAVTNAVTCNGSTVANSLNQTVWDNGSAFSGSSLYYVVFNSPYNYAGSTSFTWWQIASNGIVISNGTYTSCSSGGTGGMNQY